MHTPIECHHEKRANEGILNCRIIVARGEFNEGILNCRINVARGEFNVPYLQEGLLDRERVVPEVIQPENRPQHPLNAGVRRS